ncbi:MAG: LytTR family DNA-binding domain-containing protein [Bacteroidota bacterium]|nr:LytTR family DNA-binding domain-containing protein [Bacteroidota bacterium]
MNAVIIEDEALAAERLRKLVNRYDKSIHIVATLDSVKSAVEWLNTNRHPDFMLMDIELGDGISFEILEQTSISCPVIFTTAYNEYAIKAFKVNSIDYILKPIDYEELENALKKLRQRIKASPVGIDSSTLAKAMQMVTNTWKSRFVIRIGDRLQMISVDQIAAFVSMEKSTYAVVENKMYGLDYSLDQLEELLDPSFFFRISRKYIISLFAISDVIVYSGLRLKVVLNGMNDPEVIVSRDRVSAFRQWMDQ